MINESILDIDRALKITENISSLELIPYKSYELPDFLKNNSNDSLKVILSDIELYNSIYEKIVNRTNNITIISKEYLKNITYELNKIKEEMNKFESDYEKMIKNLSIPLIVYNMKDINSNESNKNPEEKKIKKKKVN